jgi:hypothetical protein
MSFRPKYATIPDWGKLTGMSRTAIYEALGRNDLRAIKAGNQRTLIDVDHGLAWLDSQPAIKINVATPARAGIAA